MQMLACVSVLISTAGTYAPRGGVAEVSIVDS